MNPLLYLAAHAPEQPWDCFTADLSLLGLKPKLPQRTDPCWNFTSEQCDTVFAVLASGGSGKDLPLYAAEFGEAHDQAVKDREMWEREADIQRKVQWPWWYARKLLEAAPTGINLYV